MNDHVPPKSFRCSNTSISHRWPSGLGVSCTKVFSAASPAVPAPIMATRLTCSVATGDSDVEVSLPRRDEVRWTCSGHDSQLNKTEGVHDKHSTERARVEPRITISPLEKSSSSVLSKCRRAVAMVGGLRSSRAPLQARFNLEPWPASVAVVGACRTE